MTCIHCGYVLGPFDKDCPRCKNMPAALASSSVSAPVVPTVNASNIPLIPCPACQQMVSTQAATCPHCGQPIANQLSNSHADAAILPADISSSKEAKSSTSPLMIAVCIICAILFIIGLLQVIVGSTSYENRFSPITQARDDINAFKAGGNYINPIEEDGNMKAAAILSEGIRVASLESIWKGCAFMMPMIILVMMSLARRAMESSP